MSNLPYGTSTYSRGWPAFGKDAPLYITHGDAWRAFDDQGNDYADFIMGLGSVVLGHRNPVVDEAIRRQLSCGTAFSLGSHVELEAASRLLVYFPDDCMVQWGVNGSDATTGAVRLARAVTGRDLILAPHDAYNGFHDWTLEDTARGFGIPRTNNLWRMFGLDMLETPLAKTAAAVIIEPDLHDEWLKPLRAWCSAHGALLICDEVMTWQRYPEWTASAHHGVTPDIWCLGKSLANGMPVSAIVGSGDILRRFAPGQQPNAFFSSTWAGHPLSMAAVIATLDVMEKENGPKQLWDKALDVLKVIASVADTPTFNDCECSCRPWNRITWKSQKTTREWRKLMNEHGVLIYSAHNLSLAHCNENAMKRLSEAWKNAVRLLPKRLDAIGESDESETTGVMRR